MVSQLQAIKRPTKSEWVMLHIEHPLYILLYFFKDVNNGITYRVLQYLQRL